MLETVSTTTEDAVPEHDHSSSEGSEFGAATAGQSYSRHISFDDSIAADDEPYLPPSAPQRNPGHPLEYTLAPDYVSTYSDYSASPGGHRSYSNGQNDNGYPDEGISSRYTHPLYASNEVHDYTQDGPYVPPGFYHPPPLAAQSQRHMAYQRSHQPPSQSIPHPLIAPQIQRDVPLSPSTSSVSSDNSYKRSFAHIHRQHQHHHQHPHRAISSIPASPPPPPPLPPQAQIQPDPSSPEPIQTELQMLPDEPHSQQHQSPHGEGSEPPAEIEEPEHSEQWHETDRYLRNQIGIPEGTRVDLWALPDPSPGQKPQQPLPILVKLAIHGCTKGMLTLQEIYQALEDRFEYFAKLKSSAWKNSIRHNLSLNQVFRSCDRPITEPGKGRYWSLDISKGEGYKRERRRKRRNAAPYNGTRDLPGGLGNQITLNEDSSEPDLEMDDDMGAQGSSSGKVSSNKAKKGRKRGPYTRITVPQPSIPGSTGITAGGAAAAVMVNAQLKGTSPPIGHTPNAGLSSPTAMSGVGGGVLMYVAPPQQPSTSASSVSPVIDGRSLVPPLAQHHADIDIGVGVPASPPVTLPYPISSYPPGMYFNRQQPPTFGQTSLPAPVGSFTSLARVAPVTTDAQPRALVTHHNNQYPHVGGSGDMRRGASVVSVSSDSVVSNSGESDGMMGE